MTTSTWTVASGAWNDGFNWSNGVPGPGGVAVINDAMVTLDNAMFPSGTLDGVEFNLNPVAGLTFDATDVTLGPAISIDLTGPMTLDSSGRITAAGHTIIGTGTTGGTLVVNITSSTLDEQGFLNSGTMVVVAPDGASSEIDINPVAAGATFTNSGVISLTVGTALNDDLSSLNPVSGLLRNSGTIAFLGDGTTDVNTHGQFSDPLLNTGIIAISGGGILAPSLTFADLLGPVSGDGTIAIRDGTAFFGAGDSAGAVQFSGDLGVLQVFDASAAFGATLENFGFTDQVRYYQPIAAVNYVGTASGGQLTVSFTNGGSQDLAIANPAGTGFVHSSLSATDDVVTIACFRAGTRILTAQGEVAVEHLRVGHRVVTMDGKRLAAVRWIGHRHIMTTRHPRPADVLPIRVRAGAFGAGVPHRDLYLSPDHAVPVGETLIPVRHLLNDITIAACQVAEVTYYHVELDRHAVLLAEGLPAESYLDTGNRSAFAAGTMAPVSAAA